MQLHVVRRQLSRVILTDAPRGRIASLHVNSPKRIRRKYDNAVVFLRQWMTIAKLHDIVPQLQRSGVMSTKSWSRMCRLARKCGIPARMADRR